MRFNTLPAQRPWGFHSASTASPWRATHTHRGATGFTHLPAKSGGIDLLDSKQPTWNQDSVRLWAPFNRPKLLLFVCRCRGPSRVWQLSRAARPSNGLFVYISCTTAVSRRGLQLLRCCCYFTFQFVSAMLHLLLVSWSAKNRWNYSIKTWFHFCLFLFYGLCNCKRTQQLLVTNIVQ